MIVSNHPGAILVVSLTGGIGMGKSTVAKMLSRGAASFDADKEVARCYGWEDGVQPDPAVLRDVQRLVPEAVTPSPYWYHGNVDRDRLRTAILARPSLLGELEKVTWRSLVHGARCWLTSTLHDFDVSMLVFDVPLLLEERPHPGHCFLDEIHAMAERTHHVTVVVSCSEDIQRERCMARPGMTEQKLAMLMARQMPDAEKRERADYIIDTNGTLDDVSQQVDTLLVDLKLRFNA